MAEIRKGGTEDLHLATGATAAAETTASAGGVTSTKIDATHIKLRASSSAATSIETIIGSVANIIAYGADSTGSADSTAAIQRAIDTGKTIYIPKGTYRLTATLTMDTHYQRMFGDGQDLSIIKPDNTAFTALTIASVSWTQYATFADFAIVAGGSTCVGGIVIGDGSSTTLNYGSGLVFSRIRVRGFTGAGSYGIRMRSSYTSTFQDVNIYNCYYGYYVTTESVANLITTTYISRGGVSLCRNGFFADVRITELVFDGPIIQNCTHEAIKMTGASTDVFIAPGTYFEANNASGSGVVYISGTSPAYSATKASIRGAIWRGNTFPNLYTDHVNHGHVSDCVGLIGSSSIVTTANSRVHFTNNQKDDAQAAVTLYATLLGTISWDEENISTGWYTYGGVSRVEIAGIL